MKVEGLEDKRERLEDESVIGKRQKDRTEIKMERNR